MEFYSLVGSVIASVFACGGVVYTARKQYNATVREIENKIKIMHNDTVNQLELLLKDIKSVSKRVDQHNHVVERVYALEAESRVLETRINELEK